MMLFYLKSIIIELGDSMKKLLMVFIVLLFPLSVYAYDGELDGVFVCKDKNKYGYTMDSNYKQHFYKAVKIGDKWYADGEEIPEPCSMTTRPTVLEKSEDGNMKVTIENPVVNNDGDRAPDIGISTDGGDSIDNSSNEVIKIEDNAEVTNDAKEESEEEKNRNTEDKEEETTEVKENRKKNKRTSAIAIAVIWLFGLMIAIRIFYKRLTQTR